MLLYFFGSLPECYAASLLASFLAVELPLQRIDYYPGLEHECAPFLEINPLGTLPVLDTGEAVINDWIAVLVYLAAKHDPQGRWWPGSDPLKLAQVQAYLGIARQLADSAGLARLGETFGQDVDLPSCRTKAKKLLRHLERNLWFVEQARADWLLGGTHPTIADLAIFVQVVLCEEGGIPLMEFPAVRRWLDRFRGLDRFLATGGVFAIPSPDGRVPSYAA